MNVCMGMCMCVYVCVLCTVFSLVLLNLRISQAGLEKS